MKNILSLLLGLIFSLPTGASVLLDDSKGELSTKISSSGEDFRRQRKFGIGVGAAGMNGLFGGLVEINFTPEDAFSANFGLGNGYQSFGLKYKRALGGNYFSPYFAGGFSRWYTTGEQHRSFDDVMPGFLHERFLSDKERQKGQFTESLLSAAFGLQYNQLDGDWVGLGFYAEVLMVVDVDDLVWAPTGELGLIQYF